MTYPDKEATLALLADWQKHHAAVETMMAGIKRHMGLDQDGKMFVTVWAVFGAYTDALAVEIGDYFEWLDWYRFETDMGKRSKKCIVNGKSKRVKTLSELCAVIIDERKRIPS